MHPDTLDQYLSDIATNDGMPERPVDAGSPPTAREEDDPSSPDT